MYFHLILFLIISLIPLTASEEESTEKPLAICALFHNEGPFLKEWIEFHKLTGVQHFYLYNDLSDDNSLEILQPYIREGTVEVTDWPPDPEKRDAIGHKIQWMAYDDGIGKAKKDHYRWLACIDVDEYLFSVRRDNLVDALNNYERKGIGAVAVNYQNYGSSYLDKMPTDKLLIEAFMYKAIEDNHHNRQVRSIVRPKHVKCCRNTHTMQLHGGYRTIAENGDPVRQSRTDKTHVRRLRINRYWSRSEDYFYSTKVKNFESINTPEKMMYQFNREIDSNPIILRYAPELRKIMGLH